MRIYKGQSVYGGTAIGKIEIAGGNKYKVSKRKINNEKEEHQRLASAIEKTAMELDAMYQKAVKEVGESDAAIFRVHRLVLEDREFLQQIHMMIEENRVNAEYAVSKVRDRIVREFSLLDDEYMKARALDIRDVSQQIIKILQGDESNRVYAAEPVILIAKDLAPSEMVQMNREKVLAIVLLDGSLHSHTAILSKSLGIPMIILSHISISEIRQGLPAIVDGTKGVLYIEPNDDLQREVLYKDAQKEEEIRRIHSDYDAFLWSGRRMELCANIGTLKEAQMAATSGIDGIGLFRSEFAFMEREQLPTEEEQFQIYKTVLEQMPDKSVIIRTLDIGADKQGLFWEAEREQNPALGMRGIRLCLEKEEIFKSQLKALLRASQFGKLGIMYPMITSMGEIRRIREIIDSAKKELDAERIFYGEPLQGVMIETPAAVWISEDLAEEVDFFSIGTNDLTQYTLAMDRQSLQMEKYYDPYHPAILRMISTVIKNAHKAGIKVSICGELSADVQMTQRFYEMGVDALSVALSDIPAIKKKLMEME